jgi:hypothetical protein
MFSPRLVVAATLICSALRLTAQSAPKEPPLDSARRVVQRFYDWYVPRAANPRGRDMIMEAATRGPVSFDPELVRWLRIDSTARARSKDEVVGLDGDPYLNAQDPCNAYTAQTAARNGASVLVIVLGHGGCAKHSRGDVVVELSSRDGHWVIREFLDPNRHNEGIIPLLKRLHPKAKLIGSRTNRSR